MINLSQYTRFGAKMRENPRPYAVFCRSQWVEKLILHMLSHYGIGILLMKQI
jgi:hypothetical protein